VTTTTKKYLDGSTEPVVTPAKYLVRTSGPTEVRWSGVGASSIGIIELPLNEVIKVKTTVVRTPSAEGQNKHAGSKAANVKFATKTPDEVFNDVRREFGAFNWFLFTTRDEAVTFCETGKTDHQILGIEPGSTAEEIREAYLNESRANHPDKGGDTVTFQRIVAAYKRLSK
jgi:hypothetical protein